MKKILILLLCLGLTGCASVTSYRLPSADLEDFGSIYVIHFPADKRHLESTIASDLKKRGYQVTYGERDNIPEDTDTIVSYVDRWMWDLSNYMLDIEIKFLRAKDNSLIASGKSYRPSLQRASPETMIGETLDKILKQQ